MKIFVLRLGHRKIRDERISTHCGLVARALGANGIIYSGERDDEIIDSVKKVVKKWGGNFEVSYEENWRKILKNWNGKIVHLTMYGIPIQNKIDEIRKCNEDLLIVIGSEKVPSEVYKLADWNIAITNQPHSEVAALAIFLDKFFMGEELNKNFENPEVKIIPQEKGKKLIKLK
ncbi:MAG: tRNA (cytidine(56)-2'-O)-methyltransferase [Nitrososphaerota archaeon]